MYKTLSPGAIGIRGLSLSESITIWRRTLVLPVWISAYRERRSLGAGAAQALFEEAGIKYGALGLAGALE